MLCVVCRVHHAHTFAPNCCRFLVPMTISLILRCCAVAFGLNALIAQAGPLKLEVVPNTFHTGERAFVTIFVEKSQMDAEVLSGPFYLRVPIGSTLSYVGHNNNGWSCDVDATNVVECVWSGTLSPVQMEAPYVRLTLAAPPDALPGTLTSQVTIESDQVSLPEPLVCVASPSDTGCAQMSITVEPSSLSIRQWGTVGSQVDQAGPVAAWLSPWRHGARVSVVLEPENIGYDSNNSPVQFQFLVPQGISWVDAAGLPNWTCAAEPAGADTLLTCTTPYLPHLVNAWMSVRFDVLAGLAIPGPHAIHVRMTNPSQSVDMSECVADPSILGCGRLTFEAAPALEPDIVINAFSNLSGELVAGQQAQLNVEFENIGAATSPATHVKIALPPGMAYQDVSGALPSMSCAASGSAVTGQVVHCTGAGLPSTVQGYVIIRARLDDDVLGPDQLPVVAATDHASSWTSGRLEQCIDSPALPHCAWLEISVRYWCAAQFGADGVFCNDFELLPE